MITFVISMSALLVDIRYKANHVKSCLISAYNSAFYAVLFVSVGSLYITSSNDFQNIMKDKNVKKSWSI